MPAENKRPESASAAESTREDLPATPGASGAADKPPVARAAGRDDAGKGPIPPEMKNDPKSEPQKDGTSDEPKMIQKTIVPVTGKIIAAESSPAPSPDRPPWTLQQFFNGEIDLDVELAKRFPSIPIMSSIHFRSLGTKTGRGVATMTTQDGGASVIFDADSATREVQISFTFGSMLTLRFTLDNLSMMDRSRWLELMRREQGGMAFLWGAERWEHDYLICISRKYFTNLYAFSPHNFEAAIRLTPDVTQKLLDWLETFWNKEPDDEEPPQLLTW